MSIFGRHLRDLILSQGLSQKDFAAAAGCSKGTVSNVISGTRNPPKDINDLQAWAKALNLSPEQEAQFYDLAARARDPYGGQVRTHQVRTKDGQERIAEAATPYAVQGDVSETPSSPEHNYFGNRLQELLTEHGVTATQLADMVPGLTAEVVFGLLDGTVKPPLELIPAIPIALELQGAYADELIEMAGVMYVPEDYGMRERSAKTITSFTRIRLATER